jgi:hypothetical protein
MSSFGGGSLGGELSVNVLFILSLSVRVVDSTLSGFKVSPSLPTGLVRPGHSLS